LKFFHKIKLFAFDLDGTLYFGENKAQGAEDLLDFLREKYQIAFFTNNSSKTCKEVHKKLNRLGIKCELNEVYTSSIATALYLKETGINNIYVIGSDSFRNDLQSNGLQIVDNSSAENLVVGLDLDFNYKKIATALSIILNGGKFIACNEDGSFPVGKNSEMPACGAMVGAISSSANKKPDYIVGKPNTYILSKIAETYGVKHYEIIVVGDSLKSDIQMALNYNSKGILINSNGSNNKKNILVIKNLEKLLRYIKEN
jgi:4-nitrophenyl phosphatase|tara:strand:+ start:1790 stop:2560 length:771 start_codon:yes stop_codon:yes gene_type:complete